LPPPDSPAADAAARAAAASARGASSHKKKSQSNKKAAAAQSDDEDKPEVRAEDEPVCLLHARLANKKISTIVSGPVAGEREERTGTVWLLSIEQRILRWWPCCIRPNDLLSGAADSVLMRMLD